MSKVRDPDINGGFELFVPESHVTCALETFDWEKKEALREVVNAFLDGKREKGFVLIGDPGVGKTHLLVGIFRELLKKGKVLGSDVMFLSWSAFVQELHDGMRYGVTPELLAVDLVDRTDILIIDDIRPGWGQVWSAVLKKVIEQAYEKSKRLLVSTNANKLDDLVRIWQLEDYWLSRLLSRCDLVHLKGRDRRIPTNG